MLTKKIISTLLAEIMLLGAFVITVGAEDSSEGEIENTKPKYTYNTSNAKATIDYLSGRYYTIKEAEDDKGEDEVVLGDPVDTEEKKLATMDLRFEKDGYRLYVDAYSGEVAVYCIATGEVLFSNPYTVGSTDSTDSIKSQLLSQLAVKYIDIESGTENTYYSYEWAATRGQINVKNIKNGIRVEYTIGREEGRMLVPRQIEKSAFETKILEPLAAALEKGKDNFHYKKFTAYYLLKDTSTLTSQQAVTEMQKQFPITKKMAVYILDSSTATTEMARLEGYIKTYVPAYTYEELDEDHLYAEYESEDKNPPLFKMALEYTLDEYGMEVRLPANGIRFNETLYQLYSVEILPYMGAGMNPNPGYTFFPDGSGALFDFQKIAALGTATTVTGKVYGQDFAYHTITGTQQEILRYPVFGLVETETLTIAPETEGGTTEEGGTESGESDGTATAAEEEVLTKQQDRGFLAIVEEGDAMLELSTYHAVRTSPYNTVRMIVYPRPQDTYNIADAISVGSNDTWTVVSARKYTGNYKVRYIMLTDPDLAKEKEIEEYYDCSYVGMAKAYREYLERKEILTRLTADDVKENIPLYIETFGCIDSVEKFLSIPINTMAPLTSFEDIKTMYEELSSNGVDNINFILTGYTKGGVLKPAYPYKLKWEKAVGGKSGFEDLIEYAKENGVGIFPDFDFAFISSNNLFDGLTLKSHAIKTIDNRYTSKRVYASTKQTYMGYFELAVSPAYYSRFYEKLTERYLKYEPVGIAVSSLGSYLNSDFDEDEPYNRADSQEFTVEAFKYFAENYDSVLTSGGNAYTWKYVDHIKDVALDSSRYAQAAAAVPFIGMVLHGYVQFAGEPINMEGNIDYAFLKAIENGANLNFILSYQNTNLLKNYETSSKNYSVRYDIWFDDLVGIYNELNSVVKDLQTSLIVDHQFIDGQRIPDDDEILADAEAALKEAIKVEDELIITSEEALRAKLLEARKGIATRTADVTRYSNTTLDYYQTLLGEYNLRILDTKVQAFKDADLAYNTAVANAAAKKEEYDKLSAELEALKANGATAEEQAAKQALIDALAAEIIALTTQSTDSLKLREEAVAQLTSHVTLVYNYANGIITTAAQSKTAFEMSQEYYALLVEHSTFDKDILDGLKALIDGVVKANSDAQETVEEAINLAKSTYNKLITLEGFEVAEFVPNNSGASGEGNTDTTVDDTSDYKADDYMIVRVTYDNGTSFVLNFNNYDVTIEIDGVRYTIDAYGYVVLK